MDIYNIYTFGDVPMLWQLLNGIAAYFNNQNLTGPVIRIGGMVFLIYVLYRAASHDITPGEIGSMLLKWGILCFLIYIPTSVLITDVYTGRTQKVDHVPLLISAPVSLSTTAGWSALQSLDAVFQSTSGSYLTVSQNGILGPLEILIALRKNQFARNIDPYLFNTLQTVVADCAQGGTIARGAGTSGNPDSSIDTTTDLFSYLSNNLRQTGVTLWYSSSNPQGAVIPCSSAGPALQSAFSNFINGPKFSQFLKLAVKPGSVQGSGSSSAYTFSNYDNIFQSLTNLQTGSLLAAQNSLAATTVDYTLSCLGNLAQITGYQSCEAAGLINADTAEQFKNDSVQNASFFSRTLFTAMSVMQFLFFAVTPLVIFILMIFPMYGPKIFGAYLVFGVWIGSWLIFAAPMNFYIQSQIVDVITQLATPYGGFTIANIEPLYSALSMKLAIASDIMAATPLISLAVITGSMFSLNSLAKRWSGEAHSDPSSVSNRAMTNAAVSQGSPGQSVNPNNAYAQNTGSANMNYNFAIGSSNSKGVGKTFTKSEVSNKGDSITFSDSVGGKETVTTQDVESYNKGISSSQTAAMQTSGWILAKMKHDNSQLSGAINAYAKKNNISSGALETGIGLKSLENLSKEDSNFAGKLNGTFSDGGKLTQDQILQNKAKAEKDLALNMKMMAMPSKLPEIAGTLGSYLPGVGGAIGGVVGKVAPTFNQQTALNYGQTRGLSTSRVSALERASATARQSSDGHALGWSQNESKTLTSSDTGASNTIVQGDANMMINRYTRSGSEGAQQLNLDLARYANYEAAPKGSAEAQTLNKYMAVMRNDGLAPHFQRALAANAAFVELSGNQLKPNIDGDKVQSEVTEMNQRGQQIRGSKGGVSVGGGGATKEQEKFKHEVVTGATNNPLR